MAEHPIDLRSDTVTHPTEEMYDCMRTARLGDDNLRDDPSVHELEALAASITGHEAALFCPSGTMANLLGTRLYAGPGDGVILPAETNMHRYGVIAWNSLYPFVIEAEDGYPPVEDLRRAAGWALHTETPPRLIVIEAPHNHAGGTVTTADYLSQVRDLAHDHGMAFYLDGARLFNLAVAAGRPAAEFASTADAVMFCLSKGLSAPVGSMLCGSRALIERATKMRFLMGGAMRQAGLLAACGIYALQHLIERLAEDHANATKMAAAAGRWPRVRLGQRRVETNMVYLAIEDTGLTSTEFCQQLERHGVLAGGVDIHMVRFVTHRGVTAGDIDRAIEAIDRVLASANQGSASGG